MHVKYFSVYKYMHKYLPRCTIGFNAKLLLVLKGDSKLPQSEFSRLIFNLEEENKNKKFAREADKIAE